MNKMLSALLASVALFTLTTSTARAVDVSQPFNVTVTLTSACTLGTISPLAFGLYTAFQTSPNTASTTAVLSCTRGFGGSVTAIFDDNGTTTDSSAAGATPTGSGVVAGLNYTLSTSVSAPSPGNAASTSSIGTADTITYTINGSMPADQAGTSSTGLQTQARTFTITY